MPEPPPPPRPDWDGPGPPPPGRAQALVAKSGFVVYESGRSIFDESVLVYLARPDLDAAAFDVVDHVGRSLGYTRTESRRFMLYNKSTSVVFDPGGTVLMNVRSADPSMFRYGWSIEGVANGLVSTATIGINKLSVEANKESFGTIVGTGVNGLLRQTLSIVDHRGEPIGAVRRFRRAQRGGLLGNFTEVRKDFVMAVEPSHRGELRRILIAVPVILANLQMRAANK